MSVKVSEIDKQPEIDGDTPTPACTNIKRGSHRKRERERDREGDRDSMKE